MNKILTTILTLAIAVGITASASAQVAGTTDQSSKQTEQAKASGKHRTNLMDILAKLNLSEDQKSKLKDQVAKTTSESADLRSQVKAGKLTKEDAKKKMQELRKSNQTAIRAILTKDQNKQLAALMKEAREKNKAKKDGGN